MRYTSVEKVEHLDKDKKGWIFMSNDFLKQIDSVATQQEVEQKLRQYRTYLLTVPESKIPSITASYTLEMPNYSTVKKSAVEGFAIQNVDAERERQRFFTWIARGMRKLNGIERKLIVLIYLNSEPMRNYEIYAELGMSESTFYRHRNKALYKLALSLGIEKYAQEQQL